jgi:hypothetical protein
MYADDSDFKRHLLQCYECGQFYFFQFRETIDWEKGNDPQYTTFIPVSTVDEGAELARLPWHGPREIVPRLCIDFPEDARKPTVYWARESE